MSAGKAPRELDSNRQILANAGSGKTHALVTRIIALLARKQKPDSIIALTFTRKAAGEFLIKLLTRLAGGASDPEKASRISKDIGMEIDGASCLALLRDLLADLGRMQLTTFDGFFSSVVSAFPQDLGLADSPSLLDPSAEKLMGGKALRSALAKLPQQERGLLIQALMERDHSSAQASSHEELDTFRNDLYATFLDHPESESWGERGKVWPDGYPWQGLDPAALAACRKIVSEAPGLEKLGVAWTELTELRRGRKTRSVVDGIVANLAAWKEGSAVLTYKGREYEVSPEIQKAVAALVEHLIHETLEYRLKEASAVRLFLGHYHEAYEQEVRGRGLLTFSDVTALLQPSGDFRGMTQAPPEGLTARLQLDERLDARYDHWLLDEFQDTSRSQYLALRNLLDEVIMEAGGTHGQRSFFCVGDVKQAIYGWRKGDARLFDEIYRNAHGGIRRDHLSSSWRSSAEVLEALNKVFGSLDETAPGIDELVRARWDMAWADHAPAKESNPPPGYVCWASSEADGAEERDAEIRANVVRLLANHLVKIRSGAISAAILVRSNKEASRWVEILREEGIPALSESNPPVGRDNPVASLIRSVITLMAHPGDGFAKGHLSMAPLAGIFFDEKGRTTDLSEFLATSAGLKARGGFSAVTEWALGLIAHLIRDPFSRDRSEALKRAALKADEAGITDADEFLQILEEYEEPGRSAPRSVQVMTIHKSKGLEYDMVVMPVTGKMMSLESIRNDDISGWENECGETFVMKLPPKELRALPGNRTMEIAADKHRQDQLFESLCAWYVAMSRAKSALYLFTHEPKKPREGAAPECPSFPGLIAAGLDERRSWGDPDWADHLQPREETADPDPLPVSIDLPARIRPLRKETPSGHHEGALFGEAAFSGRDAAALGTEVHELFETIDWIDPKSPWTPPKGYSGEAVELVRGCVARAELRELFAAPGGNVEIWKEKRFDLVADDHGKKGSGIWLSGCFDRVVIHRDPAGKALRADLIDYKTDLNTSRERLVEDHGEQLRTYRRVLRRLLGLPDENIRLLLIHVRESHPVVPVE